MKHYFCPKKIKARYETIILPYRSYFNYTIPQDEQYWTISSICSNNNQINPIATGCELDQMLSNTLITSNQFYGVDRDKEVVEKNKKIRNANWIHDDFYDAMLKSNVNDSFNPAIVNADLIAFPQKGSNVVSKILRLLTDIKKTNILFVANFILKAYSNELKNLEELTKVLYKNPQFKYSMDSKKWRIPDKVYVYNGTGERSTTMMGSIVFKKKD